MSSFEKKEKSMVDMFVTIEGEEWKKAVEKAFNKLSKNVTVDGFRKGQAPKNIIEKRISKAERYYQAVDDNANHWMRAAFEENDLTPISQPVLDIKEINEDKADLVYTFAVTPEVTIKDYDGLKYEVEDYSVKDEEIEKEIERLRESFAEMEIKEGKAESGDTVNIDYKGFKDDVAFEGGEASGHDLVLGSNSFIPGFEDQLIGTKAGDEVDVKLSFPEDYPHEDLKGAPVVFKVKVNEVKTKVLPEVNDDFAKDLNIKDVESLDELKTSTKNRLETQKKLQNEAKADEELLTQLIDKMEADIPDVMVEDEVQGQINQMASQIQAYGMDFNQYLQMMGKTLDDLKEDYKDNALKTVKTRLALQEIAKKENLSPSEEEINNEYQKIADQYQMKLEDVKQYISEDMIKYDVQSSKALDFVKEHAKK